MKKFGIAVLILAGIIGYLMWGYEYQFNAKVTVSIRTLEGIKTGTSVVYFRVSHSNDFWNFLDQLQPTTKLQYKGEAVVVDLGERNFVFALLNESLIQNVSREVFFADLFKDQTKSNNKRIFQKVQNRIDGMAISRDAVPIPSELYPFFVKFDDIANAQKVIKVEPNNMSATLGAGYQFQSITIAITDEPMTKGKVTAALGDGFFDRWDELKFFQSEARTTYEYKVFQTRISAHDFLRGAN